MTDQNKPTTQELEVHIRHFPEMGYTVRASVDRAMEVSVDFEIFPIASVSDVGTTFNWKSKSQPWGPEFATTLEDALVRLQGYVKWDGCSNWNGVKFHVCSKKELIEIGAIMAACHDITAELLPGRDGDE
jgi:hypothetical protein